MQDGKKKGLVAELQNALRASMTQTDNLRSSLANLPQPGAIKDMLLQNPSLFFSPML